MATVSTTTPQSIDGHVYYISLMANGTSVQSDRAPYSNSYHPYSCQFAASTSNPVFDISRMPKLRDLYVLLLVSAAATAAAAADAHAATTTTTTLYNPLKPSKPQTLNSTLSPGTYM